MLPDLEPKALVEFLELMLLTRRFEEQLIELSQERNIGHFHVYIGQESTGIPALSLLEQGDLSFTNHRNHGHLIARGAEPGPMYAEILGRVTGYCRGKGGTLHLASAEHGFPTTSSATGGCIPPLGLASASNGSVPTGSRCALSAMARLKRAPGMSRPILRPWSFYQSYFYVKTTASRHWVNVRGSIRHRLWQLVTSRN